MGIEIWYEIKCNRCDLPFDDQTVQQSELDRLCKQAKEEKWEQHDKEWYCPECSSIIALQNVVKKYNKKMTKEEKQILNNAVDFFIEKKGNTKEEETDK
jgi:rubredoxin